MCCLHCSGEEAVHLFASQKNFKVSLNSYFIPHTSKEERMPIVRPPRDLSKVKSVKKYKTRNGEVVHELVVLFDYVGLFLEAIF